MADLKLGRRPKAGVVRMTIGMPEPLKEELDRYAAECSRLYEPVDTATLIPHMIEAFIRSDRGYERSPIRIQGRKPSAGWASNAIRASTLNASGLSCFPLVERRLKALGGILGYRKTASTGIC